MPIDAGLLAILACPDCRAPLREQVTDGRQELVCTGCGLASPVRDDIPVLLVDEARRPAAQPREEPVRPGTAPAPPTGAEPAEPAEPAKPAEPADRTDRSGRAERPQRHERPDRD